MRIAVMSTLMAIVMAGCASVPTIDAEPGYPASFPRLAVQAADCPAIAGTFSNEGVQYNPVSRLEAPAVLTRDVLNLTGSFEDTDAIRLSVEERRVSNIFPSLDRSLRLEGTSGRSWQSPWGMTACSMGQLFYALKSQGGGSMIGLGVSNEVAILGIAVDRSLIVKRAHQEAGIVLVIPYRSNSNIYYYRFPPVEDRGESR